MSLVLYGGTFNMPHNGHRKAVEWLLSQGHTVVIVTAIGHEEKPEAVGSYLDRRNMVDLAFPPHPRAFVNNLEELVMVTVGLPVMAIDLLRKVDTLSWLWPCETTEKPLFAIGPDIDPTHWTGYAEIIGEGYGFVRIPAIDHPRSTDIRKAIASGSPLWREFVPAAVADYIVRRGLYGLPKPARTWMPSPVSSSSSSSATS